ncbi:MAG: nonstructural protein [Arizlama microvirus]|nr:MAG: nonstructural protein [Arizlama microvirus]
MKLIVIATYDLATETYGRPFFVHHAGAAIRSFMDEIKNPESEIGKHSADYELFELGSYDDSTGQFSVPPQPVRLVRGADFKEA